jgi:hypothetical protein
LLLGRVTGINRAFRGDRPWPESPGRRRRRLGTFRGAFSSGFLRLQLAGRCVIAFLRDLIYGRRGAISLFAQDERY